MQDNYQEVLITIIVCAVLFILIAAVMIIFLFQYQLKKSQYAQQLLSLQQSFDKQILQSQIETQEETMRVIGEELHDNVAQILSSAKMFIAVSQRNTDNVPETLTFADDSINSAIAAIRSLSKSLSKDWLAQFDLIENLTAEAIRIKSVKSIKIIFTHPEILTLDRAKQLILFRIIQEALQNVLKHAKAKSINIDIVDSDNALFVSIKDDGKGFDFENKSKGLGMLNIINRTNLLGGKANWVSNSPGTCTLIQIPL